MKKLLVRVVLVMGLFTFIFGNAGCSKQPDAVENEVKFSTYTQQERKEYIRNFLQENYDISCMISDVKQKQITVVKNEEYYFATATTDDSKIISVWITKDGKITDTVFIDEMSEELSNHFTAKASEIVPGCKVKAYTEMREIPSSKLSSNDDIEDYLYEQPAYTYIRVFVDSSANVSEETVNNLQKAFSCCDASLYVYVCEDIDDVDINTYDLSLYEYSRMIEKGK